MTMSIHDSLHAVFRVGKPQYDLLRFDFQVGLWRDRRLPDRRCCRRRRLLLLPVLREPAPGEQPDGAERGAGDVQLPLRRSGRRQPELRQLLPLQHRPIRYLLHSGGLLSLISCAKGGGGLGLIDQPGFVHQFISHCKHIRLDKPFNPACSLIWSKKNPVTSVRGSSAGAAEELVSFQLNVILFLLQKCCWTSIWEKKQLIDINKDCSLWVKWT